MQPSQGQWTSNLLANCAPQAMVVFRWSSGISLSFLPSAKVISPRRTTSPLPFGKGHFPRQHHIQLALRRANKLRRLLLGERKIHENGRVVNFNLELLRAHRLLERQREIKR